MCKHTQKDKWHSYALRLTNNRPYILHTDLVVVVISEVKYTINQSTDAVCDLIWDELYEQTDER